MIRRLLIEAGYEPFIHEFNSAENIIYMGNYVLIMDKDMIDGYLFMSAAFKAVDTGVINTPPYHVNLLMLIPYVNWLANFKIPLMRFINKYFE